MAAMSANLLGDETSPYLLQHRNNPVHWRPWGDAALAEAQRLDRPVLLSIGYAACHWCHVMAHESFEDGATAALMNELFVPIKVDREERPDIDTIYQHALALMGEHGGWPLTMFCTPHGEPFWGGTYFPPTPRYGRPGFQDILRRVSEVYHRDKAAIDKNVAALRRGLEQINRAEAGDGIPGRLLVEAARQLIPQVDFVNGGIGTAPKFPQAGLLKLFWRAFKHTSQADYQTAVLVTLVRMCQGGIYDHLGGGFARYSTDEVWLVPHFEKMLYDNAQLLDLLTDAWLETRGPNWTGGAERPDSRLFEQRARETVGWVLREMLGEGGAFASTQDADSEGEEGRFYLWTEPEVDRVLGIDAAAFKAVYDVTPEGNWEHRTILNRIGTARLGDDAAEAVLARCRRILFELRDRRVKPGWDDKILADWNGLMIAALVRAGLAFGESSWITAARRAYAAVRGMLGQGDRLGHSYRAGRCNAPGCLDDYAEMIAAALALYEATAEPSCLTEAAAWVLVLDRHFWDEAAGGYFFTADDVVDVIIRSKTANDAATPAGNAVMVEVLARLYYLTGNAAYRARAERILTAFSGQIERNVFPLATLLCAADFLEHAIQVVLVGTAGDTAFDSLRRAAYELSQPDRLVQMVRPGETLPPEHPAHGKGLHQSVATAYVCTGMTCSLPIIDSADLRAALARRP